MLESFHCNSTPLFVDNRSQQERTGDLDLGVPSTPVLKRGQVVWSPREVCLFSRWDAFASREARNAWRKLTLPRLEMLQMWIANHPRRCKAFTTDSIFMLPCHAVLV